MVWRFASFLEVFRVEFYGLFNGEFVAFLFVFAFREDGWDLACLFRCLRGYRYMGMRDRVISVLEGCWFFLCIFDMYTFLGNMV